MSSSFPRLCLKFLVYIRKLPELADISERKHDYEKKYHMPIMSPTKYDVANVINSSGSTSNVREILLNKTNKQQDRPENTKHIC